MNAIAIDHVFSEARSPAVLKFKPTISRGSEGAPVPGRDLWVERNSHRALQAMIDLVQEGGEMNPSITTSTLARVFAALPKDLPVVDLYVSAQGSICLDWDEDPQNTISLMVQSDSQLAFAAYLAGDQAHGVVSFQGHALTMELEALFRRWLMKAQDGER